MSTRGSSTTPVIVSVVLLVAGSVCLTVQALPTTSPAAVSSRPSDGAATPPTTAPAEEPGVVRVALRRLATIPRPVPGSPDDPVQNNVAGGAAKIAAPKAPTGNQAPGHQDASSVGVGGPSIRKAGQNAKPVAASDSPTTEQPPGAQQTPQQGQPVPAPAMIYPVPAPYAPYVYSPPDRVLSDSDRQWNDYIYFGGRPSRYGYGMYDYGDDYVGGVYRFGFNSGYFLGRFDKTSTDRQDAVTAHAFGHLDRGLKLFKEGRYRQAADAFKLAADTNHGDPAARLYAAHALFATGRYREAVPYLKRAFELQPKVALLEFDIRDDYGRRADFDAQYQALQAALAQSPTSVERLIMLGYIRYYTGQREAAFEPLARAKSLDPANALVDRLLPNCTPPDVVLDRQKATATPRPAR